MHIQLQQSVFLLRNMKIYGICQTFIEKNKKIKKTETKTNGADIRTTSRYRTRYRR